MSFYESLYNRLMLSGDERSGVVKRNVFGGLVLKGISIATSLILVPLTIGYVSPELYGVWLTLSSLIAWLSFLDVGFTQGLKNQLAEAIATDRWDDGKALVSTTYFAMILIFLPLGMLLMFVVPLVPWCELLNADGAYEQQIIQAMQALVFFFCLQMIVNVLVSVAAAFQKVALSSSFGVIGNILAVIVIYVLTLTCPPSLFALSLAMGAMPVVVTLVAGVFLYSNTFSRVAPSLAAVNAAYIKGLLNLGIKFFIINVQVVVLYQSTNMLISYFSSPIQVTYYNIAYRYLNVAMMLYTIITAPLWPAYTDAYTRGDYAWMKKSQQRMVRILALSLIGCCLMMAVSKPLYRLWIGNEITVPWMMTILVGCYVMIYCWMTLYGTLIVGIGKIQLETILVSIGMLVHIPLSFLLSSLCGPYGVIISMSVITLVYAIVFQIQVHKILNRTAHGIWNK